MKRILSALLTIVLLFAMSATAFAAETTGTADTNTVISASLEAPSDTPDETVSDDISDTEAPTDEELTLDEQPPTDEQPPETEEVCLCDPIITDEDGVHDNPDCSLFVEAEPLPPIQLMEVSDNNLWSDTGNYNADWPGLTNYATTTEFTITDGADLAAFIFAINKSTVNTFAGKTVTLANDIDLSAHLWDMRGGIAHGGGNGNFFSGTFDGNGHTIYGMTIDYDNTYIGNGSDFGNFGLFSELNSALVKDLTIADAQLTIGYVAPSFPVGVGILCGSIGGTTLENVKVVNATVTQKENKQGSIGFYFGGLVGIEYSPYTRTPSNIPNRYIACTVDGLSIAYSERVDDNWTVLMGFGGMIGGVFPMDAEPEYQSTISDCNINNVTLRRNLAAASFAFECYGGVIGFSPYPVIIDDTCVDNLLIDFGSPSSNTTSAMMGTPFATAMIGGLVGYSERDAGKFPSGISSITNSSVKGKIIASNTDGLLPVYIGGLVGVNDGITVQNCYTYLNLTDLKAKTGVVYGNLFGMLSTGADGVITNNIFNNFDYIATKAEIDEPSVGYLGEKLSTFAACGELNNSTGIDLSQNWGILKNILAVDERDYPLDYIQCDEKTADIDFYDYWTVDSYSHEFLSQDSNTAQVTFSKDSGDSTFPIGTQISSKSGNSTWRYTKDIIVLPVPIQYYTVTYLPGTEGAFEPKIYENLLFGDETPDFGGTPTSNTGWLFDGWEPFVADTVRADAVYTAKWKTQPTGNLTISKTVTGNDGEANRYFTFQVYFSDNGTFIYTGSKSGTIKSGETLTLHHNQSVTIRDIPVGVTYTVTELEANKNGYTTTAVNASGTIAMGGKTASFINHKSVATKPDPTGNLIISKAVTGNAGEVNRDFTFKATFNGGGSYQYIGSETGTIKSGNTVTLRHGQTITVLDIPAGTSYSVTELEANKNDYTTTVTGGSGIISVGGAAKAAFVNHKEKTPDTPASLSGDLTIKKTVTGNGGSTTTDFTFRVTFTDNGAYSYIGSKSGALKSGETVTLRHGQSITILNLTADTRYTVTELEANQNGYKTTVTGDSGMIPSNSTAIAAFVNDKTKVPEILTDHDVPKTGDDFALFLWIALLSLSGIGTLAAIIMKGRTKLKNSK